MTKCYRCQAETALFYLGMPVCMKCAAELDGQDGQRKPQGQEAGRDEDQKTADGK